MFATPWAGSALYWLGGDHQSTKKPVAQSNGDLSGRLHKFDHGESEVDPVASCPMGTRGMSICIPWWQTDPGVVNEGRREASKAGGEGGGVMC